MRATATSTMEVLPTMEEILSSGTCYIEQGPSSPGVVPCYEKWDESIGEDFHLGRGAEGPHWARTPTAKREAAAAIKAAQAPKVKAVKALVVPKEPKVNDKKVAALRLFEAHPDKNNGAIARMIAAELEITYANAYYYVTRVFKRK